MNQTNFPPIISIVGRSKVGKTTFLVKLIAELAGAPVYADEFTFHADQLRAEVASRLMKQHGVQQTPDFWSTKLNGVTPEETLRNESLRSIARFRVVQKMAFEEGLIEGVLSYREMCTALLQENLRRKEMKAAGKVFYGPVKFRQDVYFEVRMEQLTRGLQKVIGTRNPDINEAEAKSRLEEILGRRIAFLLEL